MNYKLYLSDRTQTIHINISCITGFPPRVSFLNITSSSSTSVPPGLHSIIATWWGLKKHSGPLSVIISSARPRGRPAHVRRGEKMCVTAPVRPRTEPWPFQTREHAASVHCVTLVHREPVEVVKKYKCPSGVFDDKLSSEARQKKCHRCQYISWNSIIRLSARTSQPSREGNITIYFVCWSECVACQKTIRSNIIERFLICKHGSRLVCTSVSMAGYLCSCMLVTGASSLANDYEHIGKT